MCDERPEDETAAAATEPGLNDIGRKEEVIIPGCWKQCIVCQVRTYKDRSFNY